MRRIVGMFALLSALAFGLGPTPAAAGPGAHVEAAIEHAQDAIKEGATGEADKIVAHVRNALGHAREALHEKALVVDRAANKLLHRAIRHLKLAEMRARFKDESRAIKHTVDAVTELKKIK